jgi:putative DNA primase/helicase
LPDELSDRSQDNWEPLLAIAQCVGDEWVRRATAAALKMSAASEAQGSASNDLLTDIREVLIGWTKPTIKSVDLSNLLCADDEMGWVTYNRGNALTPRLMAKYLSAYNLKPRTVRQKDGATPKGYYLDEFQDVFKRYLKPLDEA